MFDLNAQTPEMRIDISLGDFHATHEIAHQWQTRVEGGVSTLSLPELHAALSTMEAGQAISDSEDGPDSMFAANYRAALGIVRAELARRAANQTPTTSL